MADRFSRIKRGAYYNGALTNYIQYLQEAATRQPNVGSRGARTVRKQVYVTPFGKDLGTDKVVAVQMPNASWGKLATEVNGAGTGARVLETASAGDVVAAPGFTAARINYFENQTRSVTTPTSKFTGKEYLKYSGERYNIPFGRATASDDQDDAFAAVKAGIIQGNTNAIKRVSLQPERWKQR